MNTTFKLLESKPGLFFDLLPNDWQELIVPHWHRYENSSSIYVIEEKDKIIGGGIVFTTSPPDIQYFKTEAQFWFDKGYHYLGFIWICEERRGANLGSFWMNQLKLFNPTQKYWLLIEEEHLHRFYKKNGFILESTVLQNGNTEWLYTYHPITS